MRVAVIPTIRTHPWGAPGHCMGRLVHALRAKGHDVLCFVAPIDAGNPEVAGMQSAGARIAPLPPEAPSYVRLASLRKRLHRWRHGYSTLADEVAAFAPEHVFVNQGGTWSGLHEQFWQCLRQRSGRYSLICHLNQPQAAFSPAELERARALMADARSVFFPSAWVQRLAELQIARPIGNARRFRNPVRFAFDAPLPWPQSSHARFALVSRLDADHKGIDLAFRALAALRAEGERFSFRLYGVGADEPYLRQLAGFLGLHDTVEFRGHADDLPRVWADEEILLLPSRREGAAVALTEAMGFGRPVIATEVGAAAEMIEDGVSGFLCPAPEVEALRQTLRRALAERASWHAMGLRAHERARRENAGDPSAAFLEELT